MKYVFCIFPYLFSGYCFGAGTVLAMDRVSPNAGLWPWLIVAGILLCGGGIISFIFATEHRDRQDQAARDHELKLLRNAREMERS